MSNEINEQALEKLHEEIIIMDLKGQLEDEIFTISDIYGLHQDDDRDEILQFITENIFYHNNLLI